MAIPNLQHLHIAIIELQEIHKAELAEHREKAAKRKADFLKLAEKERQAMAELNAEKAAAGKKKKGR